MTNINVAETSASFFEIWYSYLHIALVIIVEICDFKLFFGSFNNINFKSWDLFFYFLSMTLFMPLNYFFLVFFVIFCELYYINI